MFSIASSAGSIRPVRTLARMWFGAPLWRRILLGLALGAVAGLILGERAAELKWIGDLFVRLIKMLVVPVVLITIAAGIAALGDPRRLGSIGGKTVGLFALTTLISVMIGTSGSTAAV